MSSVANHLWAGEYSFSDPSAGFDRYSSRKALVESYLRDLSFSEDPRLATLVGVMHDSLSSGGGRLRPVLCMEVADVFGLNPAEVLPAAAAVELLHTGSLVHESLPAISNGHGETLPTSEDPEEATVILVGDAFFSEALNLVSLRQEAEAGRLLEVIRELAASTGAGGMVGGQAISVKLAGRAVDPETLDVAHSYRTGTLLVSAARIGAVLGGGAPEDKVALSEYARQLGLCAQVTADILKLHRDETSENGSKTEQVSFVQVYGLSGARQVAEEAAREALEALDGLDRDPRGLAEMVHLAHSGTRALI